MRKNVAHFWKVLNSLILWYMCNLAFIATIILNFVLAWPDCHSKHKIQNCGGTESYF